MTMGLTPAALGILLAATGCDFQPGLASDTIHNADCNEIARCPRLDGGASPFGGLTQSQCQGDAFVALCGEDQASLCASAIANIPTAQCGLFAKGELPLACQTCVTNFQGLPAYTVVDAGVDGGDAD